MTKWLDIKKPIRFYDLGACDGSETDRFLRDMKDLGAEDYHSYCVECYPEYYHSLRSRFREHVTVFGCAIGNQEGRSKLYFSPNKIGHSLYADKKNVGSSCVEVKVIRFSSFFKKFHTDNAINILKMNIEGSQADVIVDLHENDMFRRFQLFFGNGNGVIGWTGDLYKIKRLKKEISVYEQILISNKIKISNYSNNGVAVLNLKELFR